jgi:hypothetical protein
MKQFFLILALLFCGSAEAATYYVCRCDTGAHASCAAGNTAATDTANTGTNPAIPRTASSSIQSLFNAAAAGDSVLLCRGGAWTNAAQDLQNTAATPTSRITLGAYTPSWCTGGCTSQKPILTEARASTDLLAFDNSGADDGYIVEDLYLQGSGTGQWGIFTSGNVSDIEVRRVTVDGFGIGWHCGENLARMVLKDSTVINNYDQGVLWGCVDSVIENNTFTNNGFVTGTGEDDYHYHNIYAGITSAGWNLTIRGNTLSENSILTDRCRSPSLVLHGQWDGVLIENNYVFEATTAMKDGCYGIAVDTGYGIGEYFRNVIIRGNTVVNMGNAAIGCNACPNAVIENNVVILEQPTGTGDLNAFYGIVVPDRNQMSVSDDNDTGVTIRNNSMYLFWSPNDANGINIGEYSESAGTNLTISNNLIYFGTGVNSNHTCFDIGDRVIGNFTAFVSNLCYHANGNGRWSTAYASLTAARAAGFDAGATGLDGNPTLTATPSAANGWSMKVNSGSPAINNGNATYKARNAIKGYPALGARDIGAYEFGSNP